MSQRRWGEPPREPFGFACILGFCAMLLAAASLCAQPNLQLILKDNAVGAHWIYDDFAKGVTEANPTA